MPEHFKLWQRRLNENAPSSLDEIQGIDHLDLSKGTLICLPGFSSVHEKQRELNGYMSIAQDMLGGKQCGMNFVSVSYPSTEGEEPHIAKYNADPMHYSSAGAKEFAHKVLEPLLKTNTDINILAKSYGPVFCKMALNELKRSHVKYDPSRIRLLATANISRMNYRIPVEGTEIYIEGVADTKAERLNAYKAPPPMGHDQMTLLPLNESAMLIKADIPPNVLLWDFNTHHDRAIPEAIGDPERHTTRLYTTITPGYSEAHLIRRVLRNMFALKGKDYTIKTALEPREPLAPVMHDIGFHEGRFEVEQSYKISKGLEFGKQSQKIKAILLDWDLTLADGEEVNLKALNATFKSMAQAGYKLPAYSGHWDRDAMRKNFIGTVPGFFKQHFGVFGDEVVQKAIADFRKFRIEHRSEVKLLPGAKAFLRAAQKKGIKIAIVSNKDQDELQMQKEMLLPKEQFPIPIIGHIDGMKGKPSPEPIEAAFKALGMQPDEAASTLFVGDQIRSDMAAGIAAGCRPCLIGENDKAQLFTDARHTLRQKGDKYAILQNTTGEEMLYVRDLNALSAYLNTVMHQQTTSFWL